MTDAGSHVPHPPRFWWLKRIALSSLLVIVALVVLRLIWGWRVQREFDALIASYRAKGEPTTAADFAEESIPEEENAVPLLWEAAALVTTAQAVWDVEVTNAFHRRTIAAGDLRVLRQHVAANAAALPLVRRARQRGRVYWDLPLNPPYTAALRMRLEVALCYLLWYAALDAHALGDDAAAIEYLRDALFLARALEQHPDGDFHTSAFILSDRATKAVFQICPDLTIGTGARPPDGSRVPASRRQIDELIGELLDEAESEAAAVRTVKALRLRFTDFRERMITWELIDMARPLAGHARAPVAEVIRPLVRPALDRFAIDRLHHIDAIVRAIGTSDWRVARTNIASDAFNHSFPDAPYPRRVPVTRVWTADFIRDNESREASRRLDYHRIGTTERRVAAIRLAIRAYEVDHGGARPPALAALVPEYLPHVPLDPFGDGVASFGYSAAGPWPHLSSAGVDGIDAAAPRGRSVDELARAHDYWHLPDDLFLLTARPERPPATPATSPVKDQDEDEADGDVKQREDQRRRQQP